MSGVTHDSEQRSMETGLNRCADKYKVLVRRFKWFSIRTRQSPNRPPPRPPAPPERGEILMYKLYGPQKGNQH